MTQSDAADIETALNALSDSMSCKYRGLTPSSKDFPALRVSEYHEDVAVLQKGEEALARLGTPDLNSVADALRCFAALLHEDPKRLEYDEYREIHDRAETTLIYLTEETKDV